MNSFDLTTLIQFLGERDPAPTASATAATTAGR